MEKKHKELNELKRMYKGKKVWIRKNCCPKCGGHLVEFFEGIISIIECEDCDYEDYDYDL